MCVKEIDRVCVCVLTRGVDCVAKETIAVGLLEHVSEADGVVDAGLGAVIDSKITHFCIIFHYLGIYERTA